MWKCHLRSEHGAKPVPGYSAELKTAVSSITPPECRTRQRPSDHPAEGISERTGQGGNQKSYQSPIPNCSSCSVKNW